MRGIRRLIHMIRDFTIRNRNNAVEAYSAQAALFVVISFFPAVLLLLSLMPYFPVFQTRIIALLSEVVPSAIAGLAGSIFEELRSTADLSVISVSALIALWSASKGALSLVRGLDRIYGVHRTGGYLFLRLLASIYLLVSFLIFVVFLLFLGFGTLIFHWLAKRFSFPETGVIFQSGLRALISFALLFVLFWISYVLIPQRHPRPLREIPGAIVSAGGWVGFSAGYSLYLDNIGHTSLYYGSLSLVMFSLLWLYLCMYIFFVGAEVNVWLSDNFPKKRSNTK